MRGWWAFGTFYTDVFVGANIRLLLCMSASSQTLRPKAFSESERSDFKTLATEFGITVILEGTNNFAQ